MPGIALHLNCGFTNAECDGIPEGKEGVSRVEKMLNDHALRLPRICVVTTIAQ
jgi:hypothetical protein